MQSTTVHLIDRLPRSEKRLVDGRLIVTDPRVFRVSTLMGISVEIRNVSPETSKFTDGPSTCDAAFLNEATQSVVQFLYLTRPKVR